MKLMQHLAGYLPVKVANAIAAFGSVYIFTRLLSAEDYGRFALMFSVMALVHTLTLLPAESAAYRFAGQAKDSGTLSQHYKTILSLTIRLLALTFLTFGCLAFFLRDYPAYLAILPWLVGLMSLNTFIQIALESHRAGQRVGRYAFVETTRILGGISFGALIAWQSSFGAASPFIGMLVASFILFIPELTWLWGQAKGGKSQRANRRAYLKYGLPIAGAIALDLILSASDRFLIVYFLGEAAVGEYAAGYGVADKTVLLLCGWGAIAGSPLIMAAFEEHGAEAAKREALGVIRTVLLVGVPAAAGMGFVAQPMAEALIGEEVRAGAQQIIPLIAFAGLLNGLMLYYFSEVFQLTHRTGERAILMLAPVAFNIGLNLFLIPQMGIMGAVWATVLSYALGLLVLGGVGRRLLALPIPFFDIAKVALAAAAMWLPIQIVPAWGAWPELIVKATLGGFAYVFVVLALDACGARSFVTSRLMSSEQAGPT